MARSGTIFGQHCCLHHSVGLSLLHIRLRVIGERSRLGWLTIFGSRRNNPIVTGFGR